MKRQAAAIALLACGATFAAESAWRLTYASFQGGFLIYGGGLGDPVAPSSRSKNVAFTVTGEVAKQIFEAMGPDLKNRCGAGDGQRIRQRAELVCIARPDEGYRCSFGFDLLSGRSIGGSLC